MITKIFTFILFSLCLLPVIPLFAQTNETLTISTYYPAPAGVYKELRSQKMAIGDNYYGSSYCWSPATCANQINADVNLVVEGRVGIGTHAPEAKLHVYDNLTNLRGGTSMFRLAAPQRPWIQWAAYDGAGSGIPDGFSMGIETDATYGNMFVLNYDNPPGLGNFTIMAFTKSGDVGIGTIAPEAKLEVSGQVKITGGSPGTGKVLTSDASGLASWQTPSAGSGQYKGMYVRKKAGSTPTCTSGTCVAANPFTGGCSCPAGYTAYDGNASFPNNLWCGADYYKICQCYTP
jgi:hypothetical protein